MLQALNLDLDTIGSGDGHCLQRQCWPQLYLLPHGIRSLILIFLDSEAYLCTKSKDGDHILIRIERRIDNGLYIWGDGQYF